VPPGGTLPTAQTAVASPPATAGAGGATNGSSPSAGTATTNGAPAPAPNAANVSTAPVTPSCDASGNFPIYTIQAGDTLSGVAAKFGLHNGDVPGWKLIVDSNRPELTDEDDLLQIDQKLLIPVHGCKNPSPSPPAAAATAPSAATAGDAQRPAAATAPTTNTATTTQVSSTAPRTGVVHTVVSSQTMSDIATMYDVKTSDIVDANKISDPNKLSIGQQLFIPNPKKSAPPAASIAAPQTSSSAATARSSGTGSTGSGATSQQNLNTGPGAASGLSWPTSVRTVSSYFSGSHPLGIDVDLYSQPNGPIAAAAAGTVTFAGGNSCCSYGLYVTIDHGNGLSTLYAHMSKLNVTTGSKVSKGQVIGNGGRTGYATGNHLHFEVRKDGKVVNPLSYLP
jgi:murein DD-endopeptidase MepM/ murein hydrolase activator NlpD